MPKLLPIQKPFESMNQFTTKADIQIIGHKLHSYELVIAELLQIVFLCCVLKLLNIVYWKFTNLD